MQFFNSVPTNESERVKWEESVKTNVGLELKEVTMCAIDTLSLLVFPTQVTSPD